MNLEQLNSLESLGQLCNHLDGGSPYPPVILHHQFPDVNLTHDVEKVLSDYKPTGLEALYQLDFDLIISFIFHRF